MSDPHRSARAGAPAPPAKMAPERSRWRCIGQRAFDVAGAAVCLLALSPLLAIIALWVKLDSPGRVVFGHERLGRRGRRFRCLKFRSMHEGAELCLDTDKRLHQAYVENDFRLPARLDPRLTRSGRFLRWSNLDELPQLVNVLRGEMSLVGPRPMSQEEVSAAYEDPTLILSVRPGITGAWVVTGHREVLYPARARIELDYVRHASFRLDLLLLLRTIPALLHSSRTS